MVYLPGEVLASDDLVGASNLGLTALLGSVNDAFKLPVFVQNTKYKLHSYV